MLRQTIAADRLSATPAAAGATNLGTALGSAVALESAWGRDPFVAALERAVALQRFKATDVRSILQEVNVSLSSVPQLTFDNLAGLE